MPQMTGVELFELAVRQAHPLHVSLTGYADSKRRTGVNAGHGYLEKPIPEDALVAAVRRRYPFTSGTSSLHDVTSLKKRFVVRGYERAELSRHSTIGSNEDDIILSQPRYQKSWP